LGNAWFPSIASLTDGGFVVLWMYNGYDGDWDIDAQRYDNSGNKVGLEFRVNTYTTGNQQAPAMTSLNDGGFVVAWASFAQDASGWGIYAQRFDLDGDLVGN